MDYLEELLHFPLPEQERYGYQFTAREIAQQPATWLRTRNRILEQLPAIQSFLLQAGLKKDRAERPEVFLVGAGSSDYIGRCLYYLLRRAWQCNVWPVPSTDLLMDFGDLVASSRPGLWISFSRSGDSPEGAALIELALEKYPHIHHVIISCNVSGKMGQLIAGRSNCLGILLDEETNDRGLAMTSSFTNMMIAGQVLAHAWSSEAYDPILTELCGAAAEFLPLAANAAKAISEQAYPQVCFAGSGAQAGTATEAALKLLELTAGRVQTMAHTPLGLRHGPMAALTRETLFVSFLSNDIRRQRYESDLLHEIERKKLVGKSLAILGSGTSTDLSLGGASILMSRKAWSVPDLYRPPVDILFAQLLGLFSSLRYGLKPDAPSPTGAISRVVHPIEVYY